MGSRIRNLVLKASVVGTLALTLGGGLFYTAKKTNLFDGRIPVVVDGKKIEVPVYNHIKLKSGNCSGYVRLAAKDIFGEEYQPETAAWDRRHKDMPICKVERNEQLVELAEQGILQPGMIVGVFYPRSTHLNEMGMDGEKVPYTHNMLYLGRNDEGKLVFAEQFGRIRTRTLEQFAENGLEAREIIASRRNRK